jgi:hypothetical protein
MGKKQTGFITCSERVALVTLCVAVNETGNCFTPIFEVPRKIISQLFSSRLTYRLLGAGNGSGWFQGE